jgi:hypothetical protein
MLTASRIATVVAALLVSGCAHMPFDPPLTAPSDGGAPWIAVTSRHFELLTDLSRARGLALSAELERIEAAFEDLTDFAFAQRPPPPGRVTVVAFAREADYRAIATSRGMPNTEALFTVEVHDLEGTPTIIMHGELDSITRETLQHELTHRFVRFHLRDVPVWLNEGLAQYFSTLDLNEGYAYFGRMPKLVEPFFNPGARVGEGKTNQLRWLTLDDLPRLSQLLAAGPADFYAHEQDNTAATVHLAYPASWLLVHLLSSSKQPYSERLRQLINLLANGVPRAQAFERAFAGVPLGDLEAQYRRYALTMTNSGQTGAKGDRWVVLERTRYEPRKVDTSGETRALDDLAVRMLFVRLDGWTAKTIGDVRVKIEMAEKEHRGAPEIHFVRGLALAANFHDFVQAEPEMRAAVTAQPKEGRYWLGLVFVRMAQMERTPGNLELLEDDVRNLARRGHTGGALNTVAWYYALRKMPQVGMPFAMRSVAANPTCAECFDTLALLQSESGMLAEAVTSQERACELLPEGAQALGFQKRLDEYRRLAAPASTAN